MKNSIKLIIISLLLFVSCNSTSFNENSEEANTAKKEVLQELFAQQDCWNNGDIDCFMKGYWNNDSLMFVSGERISYGWTQVTDNYKRKYSSKELMGHLTFKVEKAQVLSANSMVVVGQWDIKSESANFGGKFTLLWKKINGEWKIVIDHTS
ncbi:MAG: YybH family protein [Salibacteraceae bacterium]